MDKDTNLVFNTPDLKGITAYDVVDNNALLDETLYLSKDEGDFINFKDENINYAFYAESLDLKKWQLEVMRVLTIDGITFCKDDFKCRDVLKIQPNLRLVNKNDFLDQFYSR